MVCNCLILEGFLFQQLRIATSYNRQYVNFSAYCRVALKENASWACAWTKTGGFFGSVKRS